MGAREKSASAIGSCQSLAPQLGHSIFPPAGKGTCRLQSADQPVMRTNSAAACSSGPGWPWRVASPAVLSQIHGRTPSVRQHLCRKPAYRRRPGLLPMPQPRAKSTMSVAVAATPTIRPSDASSAAWMAAAISAVTSHPLALMNVSRARVSPLISPSARSWDLRAAKKACQDGILLELLQRNLHAKLPGQELRFLTQRGRHAQPVLGGFPLPGWQRTEPDVDLTERLPEIATAKHRNDVVIELPGSQEHSRAILHSYDKGPSAILAARRDGRLSPTRRMNWWMGTDASTLRRNRMR